MDTQTQQIASRLDDIYGLIWQMAHNMPPLSQSEFARRAGLSRTTVSKKINAGHLMVTEGRIPYSELLRLQSGLAYKNSKSYN